MIKCNRCGNMNTAEAVCCQSCGSALSGIDMSGNGSNTVSQQQSALPAWLESLHVGERAPRPATNTPKFSAANLIEEGSLPSWMHAQRDETKNVTDANMPVSLRPSSLSAPSTDDTTLPTNNFAAQSLIDEQVLPSWMQEGKIVTPLPPEDGIAPARLVDKESMPDWMKSLQQQQSGASGQGQSQQVTGTASTGKMAEPGPPPSSSPAAGFAARDLIDQQFLPSWMTQLGNQNPATPANYERMAQQPQSSSQVIGNEQPSQPIQRGQKELAGRDLIDQQSLPSWMLSQKSGQNAAPTNNKQEKQSDLPAIGLPASSLLDMNALPSWLAENGQAQAVSPAYAQPSIPMVPSSQPRSPQEPAAQGSGADVPGGRIAASSVIDMNALPEWLRSSGKQQSVPNTSSQSYSAPYVGPPRVENVRVPSRPRGEINSSETSEIAASVFTSMLGVASAAPRFPASPQQQSGQLSYGEQTKLSGVSGIAGMPVQAGIGNPGGVSITGIPGGSGIHNMAGMQGGPGAPNMAGIPGGSGIYNMAGMQGGPGIYNMAGMQGGPGAQNMAGIPGGSGIYNMAGMQGGPGAQSMAGIPGGSGIYNMAGMQGGPGAQSMAGMQGGPGAQSMAGMQGGPGAQSMVGNPPGPSKPGMAGEQKNTKKRGLFGALLDWLSR